jgi:hypothetical protein
MSVQLDLPLVLKLNRRRARLNRARREQLIAWGLHETDLLAIERTRASLPNLEKTITDALVHYRRYGAKILAGLRASLDDVIASGHRKTVGPHRLAGKAWCDSPDFALDNSLAAFYGAILTADRPEIRGRKRTTWVDLLVAVQWPPVTPGRKGGNRKNRRRCDDDRP